MPQRVQRKRVKGEPGMPPGAVYVGRPSMWGNPWRIGQERPGYLPPYTAKTATRRFEMWLTTTDPQPERAIDRALILNNLHQLRGKDLACWCPLADADGNSVPCHADVLLRLANSSAPVSQEGGNQ